MPAGGLIRHDGAVHLLEVSTGSAADVVNVRGSLAGDRTVVATGAGDDRTFVSSDAAFAVPDPTPGLLGGHLRDVLENVEVDAGTDDNLLMVSRRDDGSDVVAGAITPDTIAGFAGGTITYGVAGTFTQGVTAWTGSGDDTVEIDGVRSDGDTPTMAWQYRDDSGVHPRTVTTLNSAGDDVGPNRCRRGFVAFGGDGADRILTGDGDDIVFGDRSSR
jgi:hypothetical protein